MLQPEMGEPLGLFYKNISPLNPVSPLGIKTNPIVDDGGQTVSKGSHYPESIKYPKTPTHGLEKEALDANTSLRNSTSPATV